MKIIDVIKNRLGLKDDDLDKEMDIETSQALESAFMEASDELISEKVKADRLNKTLEAKGWAERVVSAHQKRREQNETRTQLRKEKLINPRRRMALKKQGKLK